MILLILIMNLDLLLNPHYLSYRQTMARAVVLYGGAGAGIDYLKTCTIHMTPDSPDIIKEQKSYIYKKNKDANSLNVPIEFNNHAISAIRYYIYTKAKEHKQTFTYQVY